MTATTGCRGLRTSNAWLMSPKSSLARYNLERTRNRTVIKSLPNILTGARLIMALFVFVGISIAVGGFPPISDNLAEGVGMKLQVWAVIAFFVAGITDFFDGWLARKLDATS